MKKKYLTKIVLLISFLFMISCNEEDDTTENNQQQEELGQTFCDFDPNNLMASFDWVNDLINEDVVEVGLYTVNKEMFNGEVKDFYYVIIKQYTDFVSDGNETFNVVANKIYDCSGNVVEFLNYIEGDEFYQNPQRFCYTPETGGGNLCIPYELDLIGNFYSNHFDFSTPIEEIPWLNAKKNELENSGNNGMITLFNGYGDTYYVINDCLECTTFRRFKIYNYKGQLAGYFGSNNFNSSVDAYNSYLVNTRGILGEKLYYNIINTNDCEQEIEQYIGKKYKYHGQTIYYDNQEDIKVHFDCGGNIINVMSVINGINSPFPDWDEEAILLEEE
ncbi:hypothetical protein [Aureivirga marina]|uniref:hypothetical protein n=1 Tax=Aureivirga marina TaxID=1182451 RepID=UPI0018CBA855|nr:hypothetical protein [Aureivirga marina]